jgi:transposase
VGKRGFATTAPLHEVIECIFHRLKTGTQWRELPTKEYFSGEPLSWHSVHYYFNKWCKAGCWKTIRLNMLKENLRYLDMSSVEFDGSHTLAKNGGDAVGYQDRKSSNTTNALFLSDKQGVMLSMSTPQEGNHHDLFEIQQLLEEIRSLLKEARIELKGLFLNADAGFDSAEFKGACEKEEIILNVKANPRNSKKWDGESYQGGTHIFDEELYKERTVIEHANAWMDGFKSLLIRFEFSVRNWMNLHFMAFTIIFLRKINKKQKFKQPHLLFLI